MVLGSTYRFGRFELDPARRQLLADGGEVTLGARAFDVLLALVERRERLVTKDELLQIAWPGLVVEENNLQVQVSSLRKILGPQAIVTLPGRGYRFAAKLESDAPVAPEHPPDVPEQRSEPQPAAAPRGPRLTAVVITDVVGYSARLQRDEAGTIALVNADFERMRALCGKHGGESLNATGDGLLLRFPSAVEAVACALEIQAEFAARKASTPPDQVLEHRIGVHLGDVYHLESGDVAGDGVSIASRLESKAPPGGICLSQTVYDTVKGRLPMQARFLGRESFKNIVEPIPIWMLVPEGMAPPDPNAAVPSADPSAQVASPTPTARRTFRNLKLWSMGIAAALVLLAPAGWYLAKLQVPAVDPRSIAVLPFANLSDDKNNEYFSDGISEELLTTLQKVPGLRVVGRVSSFSFKGSNATAQEIGQKLNVAHLIEGSVRRSGESVRITARLSRAATGEQLWSDGYTRDLKQVFELQSELAQTIAEQLRGHLDDEMSASAKAEIRGQIQAAARGGTKNAEAHQLYLEGLYYLNQVLPETWIKAAEFLELAVALDPTFALAWSALSRAGAERAAFGPTERDYDDGVATARRAADRALALAPELPSTQLARMTVQMWYDFDWKGAAESLRRAQMVAPMHPDVLRSGAQLAYAFGQKEVAVDMAQQSVARDPLNSNTRGFLALALVSAGRHEEADAQIRRITESLPDLGSMAYNFFHQGRFEDALREAAQEKFEWARLFIQAPALWALGKQSESDEVLARFIASSSGIAAYNIAGVYAFRRENDPAFAWLERAYRQREPGIAQLRSEPMFERLHKDPRWSAFLKKIGLADELLPVISRPKT